MVVLNIGTMWNEKKVTMIWSVSFNYEKSWLSGKEKMIINIFYLIYSLYKSKNQGMVSEYQ